MEELNRQSAR